MKIWTQEEEAARLLKRFTELKKAGIGQAKFAREFDVPGGPSMLSQQIYGRRPLNLEAAIAYAKGFGCTLAEISPRLAHELVNATHATGLNVDFSTLSTNPVSEKISQIETGDTEQAILVLRDALSVLNEEARQAAEHLMSKMASQPDGRWAERLIDLMKAEKVQQSAGGSTGSSNRPVKPLITKPTGKTTIKTGISGKNKQRLKEGLLPPKEALDEPRKPGRVSTGKAR